MHKLGRNIQISNFRKPTFTDTIRLYIFNHPTQHKYSAIRYLHSRLHSHQLNNKAYTQELNTIQKFLYKNSYPIRPPKTPKTTKKYTTDLDLETPRQKWATCTYVGKELHKKAKKVK